MMNKVLSPEVIPAFTEKISIMHLPDLADIIATKTDNRLIGITGPILFPSADSFKNRQHKPQPHVKHDASVVVKAVSVVQHNDSFSVGLQHAFDLVKRTLRVGCVMQDSVR